jgi:hypothetical protein
LEKDPPYGSKVTVDIEKSGTGWDAPETAPWLEKSLHKASETFYKQPPNFIGEGGSVC